MSDSQNVSILNQTILRESLHFSQKEGQRERDLRAANALNVGQHKLKSPILRNVVNMPWDVEFHAPDGLSIDAAYNAADIELKDSHKNKVLEESHRKFALQQRLAEKLNEAEGAAKRPAAIQISIKEALKLIYDHVFNHTRDNDPDWDIFFDALKSLGMKIRIPKRAGEKPMPSLDAIYACLMK